MLSAVSTAFSRLHVTMTEKTVTALLSFWSRPFSAYSPMPRRAAVTSWSFA